MSVTFQPNATRTEMVDQPTKRDDVRPEPEIIPPDRAGAWPPQGEPRVFFSINDGHGFRSYKPPGPFAIAFGVLGLIAVVALVMMLVLGALLIWVPVLAVVAAGFVVTGLFKGYWRRPR